MIERALLTVFGLGYLRPAPGTWGSLPPVVMAWALVWAVGEDVWLISIALALMAILFTIACVRFGGAAEVQFGRKDAREIVADETAGQSIALLFLPWQAPEEWQANALFAGIAFASFRLFDIVKPPPAHQLQRRSGGWGIVLDDLVAGAFALIVTQAATRALIAFDVV